MEGNFLNFKEQEIDKPIFRIIPTYRLFELFEKNINILVNPKLWDDPFENFIMNSKLKFKSGISLGIGFKENLYGQCWTRTRESDAMWRIYSPQKNGVRIATTPRKLLTDLYNDVTPDGKFSAYIGRVKYYKTKNLIELLNNKAFDWIMDKSGEGPARTLLFKRVTFKHENEVRLIYNSFNKFKHEKIGYNTNGLELIDDIVFDPRIDYNEYRAMKEKLRNIGFEKRIVKSKLYQIPELTIKL